MRCVHNLQIYQEVMDCQQTPKPSFFDSPL
jgi:hypothetical protein